MNNRRRSVIIANSESSGGAPNFSNASWADIQAYINNYGTEGFADQVGSTRSITLSDSSAHTLRLANVAGNLYELADGSGYTGMIVEFADCVQNSTFATNGKSTGALDSISPIGTTVLPAIKAKLPQDLQAILAIVKVGRASKKSDTSLVSSDMDLFIPAMSELLGAKSYISQVESNTFPQWKCYADNDTDEYRIKKYNGTAQDWWSRSAADTENTEWSINLIGRASSGGPINYGYVSPCFCLAKQPPTPPDFSTAPWSEIQEYINENGTNGFADQVGTTRSITLTDSSTHTLRLANATGNLYELADSSGYTGMVVEFADVVKAEVFANTNTNIGALADFDPMGTTTLPTIQALLPSELQSLLTNVKVIRANSGKSGTLVSSNMKLFIPAVKEIFGNVSGYGRPEERSALTQWAYYSEHTATTDRQKKYYSAYYDWWFRTGYSGTDSFCTSDQSGNIGAVAATRTGVGVSPCFCLAPTSSAPTPTPTSFADDDWATIKYAVDNNLASAVYSVGDTKTITLSDSSTHTLRIANITGNLYEYADNAGTYTGFVMEFADVPLLNEFAVPSSGSPGALDTIDPIGTTVLPNIEAMLPSNMASVLSTVKVLKSTSGTTKALISADMKLFLPAERELFGTRAHSTTNEWNAFSRWEYYATNDTTAARTKLYKGTQNMPYWLRSPESDASTRIVRVTNGSSDIESPATSAGISPCFCI